MDEEYYLYNGGFAKNRSGQIPAFGDWDYANDLPITQYFECARQAGLIRYSSSSGECDVPRPTTNTPADLYAPPPPPPRKTRAREKRCPNVKEQKKAGRICDVTQPPTRPRHVATRHAPASRHNVDGKLHRNDAVSYPRPRLAGAKPKPPKAVDEDLYKIPPELLHSSNRKKRLGFISRCLVPACSA
ncbi:uncharacterized protein LOC116197584 [Punica granatum]|uniref:Uncharacterized protein n=2 Tax=Punica granatum TaxID=22663 RepID=A0A2I0JJI4_PUNGR|nr:uncharacterized protein LOC116197584 [Punica granatum]PKI56417.1 hypothetical protein CRG98_023155 [Punica granatum]